MSIIVDVLEKPFDQRAGRIVIWYQVFNGPSRLMIRDQICTGKSRAFRQERDDESSQNACTCVGFSDRLARA